MVAPEKRLRPCRPSPRDWMTAWTRPSSRSTATPTRWPAWRVRSNSCRGGRRAVGAGTGCGARPSARARRGPRRTAAPRDRAGRVPFSATHSSTWASGTTYRPPAVSTSSPSIRARVSGRRKMNAVPLPGRALDRQAAAQGPHGVADDVEPDAAARELADLVAGREARLEDQADDPRVVGRRARRGPCPARSPCGRSARGRGPRPSSSTRIATRSPSWPAESVIRPTRGLPFCQPLLRESRARGRRRCGSGGSSGR